MLLSRMQSFDFVRLEGLQKLTNVTAHDWDIYILKELVDNALDADEMLESDFGAPAIRVVVEYDREAYGLRITVSNRALFPLKFVGDLFDLEKRVSVKDYYNRPTRGAQGNALKTILGIPYALHHRFFSDYSLDETPFVITCANKRVEIRLAVDELHQSVRISTEEKNEDEDAGNETTVSVGIFRFVQKQPRTSEELRKLAKAFALFNPNVSFSFTFVFLQKTGDIVEEHFETVGDPDWQSKYDRNYPAPITWYSYSEFKELLYAVLMRSQEYQEPTPKLDEIGSIFGILDFPQSGEFFPETRLDEFVEMSSLKTDATRELFKLFKQNAHLNPVPSLGEIGELHFRESFELLFSEDRNPLFFYRRGDADLSVPKTINPDTPVNPFVLEVVLMGNLNGKRQVIVGINHTPTYQDPFFNKPLVPHNTALEEVQTSLEKLLDFYDLRNDTPITLIVHLIAPNIVYENYGKSAISDEPYRDVLTRLVYEVVEEYSQATRPLEPIDYITDPAQSLLDGAIATLAGKNFSENQLVYLLKRLLMQLNSSDVHSDLISQTAEGRLRGVIRNYHSKTPIVGLYSRPNGRIAVPQHPQDSINVFFDNVHLLELLRRYRARAILITTRETLEELFIALDFPIYYDCSILRADGNFKATLELLLHRMSLVKSSLEWENQLVLPKLWLVYDLTVDSVLLRQEILYMVQKYHLPTNILIDLGLHIEDVFKYDVVQDKVLEAPAVERKVLEQAGCETDTIQYLIDEGHSVQLDSMTPVTLAYWFESKLLANSENLKTIPNSDELQGLIIEDLQNRVGQVVGNIFFTTYELESVQVKVIEEWRNVLPTWANDLHILLRTRLQDDPRQNWQHVLKEILNSMLHTYLTTDRELRIQQLISSQVQNIVNIS